MDAGLSIRAPARRDLPNSAIWTTAPRIDAERDAPPPTWGRTFGGRLVAMHGLRVAQACAVPDVDLVAEVQVPAARLEVWEASTDDGWRCGVRAVAHSGQSTFAGVVWHGARVARSCVTALPAATARGTLAEVKLQLRSGGHSTLDGIAELALLKLGLLAISFRPEMVAYPYYVSALSQPPIAAVAPNAILKTSLTRFEPGEEKLRPTAIDAQEGMASWDDVIAFGESHPTVFWIEDPMPAETWPKQSLACAVPVATGEHASSAEAVDRLLVRLGLHKLMLNLELSRLGPLDLLLGLRAASEKGVPTIFHGHLPFDTALVLQCAGVKGLIELNVAYLKERAPWIEQKVVSSDAPLSGRNVQATLYAKVPGGFVPRPEPRATM